MNTPNVRSLDEKRLSSASVFKGKIFDVEVDEVLLPDGSRSKRECVRHPGGAAVLFVKNGCIALVRQFRYLYGGTLLEIPAGKLERGEDPALAAARELAEETGYRTHKLSHLLDIYPTPGYTDEVIHIYFANADDAVFEGQKLDRGEFLSVSFYPVDEVKKMIADGRITDGKTVAAVLAYLSGLNA